MKRLMVTTVVLMSVWSSTALAGPWTSSVLDGYGCGYGWYSGYGGYGGYGGYSGYGGYGGYGGYSYGYDRTLGRVVGYGGLALNALQTVNQLSTNDRVLSMAEKEQDFRQEQIRAQNNTVLVRIERPEETQKNEELQQKIRILELELEKLKLQQKLNK